MHRAAVLRLLRAHQPLAADPHEAAMAAEIIRFVEAHPDCLLRTCAPGHLTGSAWKPRQRRLAANGKCLVESPLVCCH